ELRPCPSIRTALAIRLLPVRRGKAVARNDSPSARDRDFLIGTGDLVGLRRGEAMIDLGRGHRPAEAVALHRMHAGGAQEQMLFGGPDAFRRHLHAEAAAEADDGMNDRRGIGSLLDRAHETRIDLELVERKTPQIKQARIAGAEIIERKTHADAFEPRHREFRALEITEQGAFGEFEFELVGRKAGLAEYSLNRLDEIRPPELQLRHIDR